MPDNGKVSDTAKIRQAEPVYRHFEETTRSSNLDTQFFRHLKWRCIIGMFNGVFPVQNVFRSKSEYDLVFKRRSLIYFSSWFILILKVFGFLHVASLMAQTHPYYEYKPSFTDLISIVLILITSYCFGISMHLLNVLNVSKLLELIVAVADYRRKYPALKMSRHSRSVGSQLLSICVVFSPLYNIWYLSSVGLPKFGRMTFVLPGFGINSEDNFGLLFLYCAAVFWYLELGVMYLFGQLSFATHSIVTLMDGIVTEVEQKFQDYDRSKSKDVCLRYSYDETCWSRLSHSYLEFLKVFEKYENYVAPKYLVLYLVLTIGNISGAYYITCSDDPVTSELGVIHGFLCFISMYRVYNLANTGESIRKQHGRLAQTLSSIGKQGNMSLEEKYDFTRFVAMVDNMPVILNAKGFFEVRRSNIPKIMSLILTYIIVLLQFRMLDKMAIE